MALGEERESRPIIPSYRATANGSGAGTVTAISAGDIASGLSVRVWTMVVSLSAAGNVAIKDSGATSLATLYFAGAGTVTVSDSEHGVLEVGDGLGLDFVNSAGDVSVALSFTVEENDQ